MAKLNQPSEFDSKFINERRNNTKSDLIEITEDKLENILLKHLSKLKKAQSWLTPLSLFVTILIVLLTTEFKEFLTIGKDVWNAVFIVSLLLTFGWMIKGIYDAIKCSGKNTIEYLINQIKNNQEE